MAAQHHLHPGLGHYVVNQCTDTHAQENIWGHLFHRVYQLSLGIVYTISPGQGAALAFDVGRMADEILHIPFHPQLLQKRAADYGNDQPQQHIQHRHAGAEHAHQQHQGAQVHHGGGDEKGEGHAHRKPGTGKAHENGDRRTGTEGRHRPQ